MIAFETGTFEGGQAIWIARPDGSDARKLTTGRYYDIGGVERGSLGYAWKPDGSALLFAAGDDQAHDLYVIGLAPGSQDTPIATSPQNEFGATYSPDGRYISYLVAPRDRFATVMIANGDGSDAHPAVEGSSQAYAWPAPRWSPDARFITATTEPDANFQAEVWIIDVAARSIHARIPILTSKDAAGPGGSEVVGFQRVAP